MLKLVVTPLIAVESRACSLTSLLMKIGISPESNELSALGLKIGDGGDREDKATRAEEDGGS